MLKTSSSRLYGYHQTFIQSLIPSLLPLVLISLACVQNANTQMRRMGQMGSQYQGTFESYNKFGLPSLIIPVPCQANKLQEQVNYICAHGNIWCLPGWKVKSN